MYKAIEAKVHKEAKEGTYISVLIPGESLTDGLKKLAVNGVLKGELRIDDGRIISAEQRKKAYATLADIALYTGHLPEEIKEIMKYMYVANTGEDYFSFRSCSMTTARNFISYILDFAIEWGIPLMESGVNRTDDINKVLYSFLKHKKCAICHQDGEVHHWDAIGAGRNRETVDDSKLRKICLCRKHHTEAHTIGSEVLENKYHVYGIIFE